MRRPSQSDLAPRLAGRLSRARRLQPRHLQLALGFLSLLAASGTVAIFDALAAAAPTEDALTSAVAAVALGASAAHRAAPMGVATRLAAALVGSGGVPSGGGRKTASSALSRALGGEKSAPMGV